MKNRHGLQLLGIALLFFRFATVSHAQTSDPRITSSSQNPTLMLGQSYTFYVAAEGTPPFGYQWLHAGTNLPGATLSTLRITNAQAADVGSYQTVVTNVYGSVTSSPSLLTVNLATLDSFDPAADGMVHAMAVQGDGKIVIAGEFGAIGGQPRSFLARLERDGRLDSSFNPVALASVTPQVFSLAIQDDGRIIVGGAFTNLAGRACSRLARLNADGTLDTNFFASAAGTVSPTLIRSDGKILVGGWFSTMNGVNRLGLALINTNGSLDTNFNAFLNGYVYGIAAQPNDGKILVAGSFTSVKGQVRNRIARLNFDGSLDATFNPNAENNSVSCVAVQPDGKILVGGGFTRIAGQARPYLARLNANGTLDTNFTAVPSGLVCSIVLQCDGKILISGGFEGVSSRSRAGIARLEADGMLDCTFAPQANGWVQSLGLQPDGKVLLGGSFSAVTAGTTATTRRRLARLNNTGSPVESLTMGGSTITWTRSGCGPEVWRTCFEYSTNGNDWFAVGEGVRTLSGWQYVASEPLPLNVSVRGRGRVAQSDSNGSSWLVDIVGGSLAIGVQPQDHNVSAGQSLVLEVSALGVQPLTYQWRKDGQPLVDGGDIQGATSPFLSLSNILAVTWGGYSVVVSDNLSSITSRVAWVRVADPVVTSQPTNSQVYIGADPRFSVTVAGTGPLFYQWLRAGAAIPGATSSSLQLTNVQAEDDNVAFSVVVTNSSGSVTSSTAVLSVSAALPDPTFPVVRDLFSAVGDGRAMAIQADGRILVAGRRLSTNGIVEENFDLGLRPSCLALQADGSILVGGESFRRFRADGTPDDAFAPGITGGNVYTIAIRPDGRILLGGDFTAVAGTDLSGICQLAAGGQLDAAFAANLSYYKFVNAAALQTDGRLVLGALVRHGPDWALLSRVSADGTKDSGFLIHASSDYVYSVLVQPDGKVVVGGDFTGLQGCSSLARLTPDGTLDPSFKASVNGAVTDLALQADGKILVGGYFTQLCGEPRKRLGRLNSDGSLDRLFNPLTNGNFRAFQLLPDGKILVDSWNLVNTQFKSLLQRFDNTEPGSQRLLRSGTTLRWLRGGSAPEVWRSTFEYSTDGAAWTSLGAGIRVAGGWQVEGLPEEANLVVRARGYVATSGLEVSASWFVEMVGTPEGSGGPEAPRLLAIHTPEGLWLKWPSSHTNYVLEYTSALGSTAWERVPGDVVIDEPHAKVLASESGAVSFFRLRRQ